MTVKNKFINWVSKHSRLDKLLRNSYTIIARGVYRIYSSCVNVEDNIIVFEAFSGRSLCDSPLALYEELKTNKDLKFVWVVKKITEEHREIRTNNTRFVKFKSKEYFYLYAKAKYWLTNCRLPYELYKKDNQVYIQCWHGTPLKKIGCDITIGSNKKVSLNALKSSYIDESKRLDFFISPSAFASKCFKSAFKLDDKKILELGYPRNDSLIVNASDHYYLEAIRKNLNIPLGKKVVLYAPTWRDNNVSRSTGKHTLVNFLDDSNFVCGLDELVFLYRGHYFTHLEESSSSFIDVSDYDNVNDLMLISDLLITDYSSLLFDFALLNRPIMFFMPDRDTYENENRGFYLNIDTELPGEIFTNIDDLRLALCGYTFTKVDHTTFNLRYNPYEDGLSSSRVIKRIGIGNG